MARCSVVSILILLAATTDAERPLAGGDDPLVKTMVPPAPAPPLMPGWNLSGIWMSNIGGCIVNAANSGISWNSGEVVRITDPNLALVEPGTTNGTFRKNFDIDDLAGTDEDILALHLVSRTVTLPTGPSSFITLQPGDVLFSLASDAAFGSTLTHPEDVVLFQPTSQGDYSAGALTVLLDAPTGRPINSIALVEAPIVIGATPIPAGNFLMVQVGASFKSDVYRYEPVYVGENSTSGAASMLLEGADLGFNKSIDGLDVVMSTRVLGGVTLTQGQVIMSIDQPASIGTNNLSVDQFEVFALSVSAIEPGTSTAGALKIFDGTDVGLAGNSEDIDAIALAPGTTISGTVFEDVNYGGGAGRTLVTATGAGGTGRNGARVELFDGSGNYVAFTTTASGGAYSFTGLAAGTYTVRVVNSTVSSARAGYVANTHLCVQTFRTNANTGSAVAVTDHVGGEVPNKVDAGNGSTTLAALTTATLAPQSITTAIIGSADITGIDFGYNFDVVCNTSDVGQGSLRQFIINANGLGGDAGLAQVGVRKDANGADQALPAGKESSIFMISNGLAHPGLRAGTPAQLDGSGVARLNPSANLPAITGANTNLDATTQTANVGNTNALMLGAGGTVGVDGIALAQVPAPEVEIVGVNAIANCFDLQANNVTVRGCAISGFGNGQYNNNFANIVVRTGFSGTMIELNVLGSSATSFTDPGAGVRTGGANILFDNSGSATVTRNLIGFAGAQGVWGYGTTTTITVSANEVRNNGLGGLNWLAGIDMDAGTDHSITDNLVVANRGPGIILQIASGNEVVRNNTSIGNGIGNNIRHGVSITGGTGALVERNILTSNVGAGVMVATAASGVTITRNSIDLNGTLGIDLGNNGVSANDPSVNMDSDGGANGLQNFPVLTKAYAFGGTTYITGSFYSLANSTFRLEFYSSPVGDALLHGEGATWLGTTNATTDASGNATLNLTFPGVSVVAGHAVAATATWLVGGVTPGNTSEFSRWIPAGLDISGTVFEDVNYGGGNGRDKATALLNGGTPRSGARVELYNNAGSFITSTTTNASGVYTFTAQPAGSFTVRVVNNSVTSARTGYVAGLLPVQIFRTNAVTGTPVSIIDQVGGEVPSKADSGNGSTTLAALTTATTTAQTIIPVTLTTTDITGVDAGFNFDLVVNTNDAGQGSLRQFILNANALGNTGLALQGQTAGRDVALFMISDGIAHPGSNAGMANLLTGGVAKINLASGLPAITETVTISGNVQTSLIGNTNPGLVGTGGFVGVDNIPFAQFNKPEVEVNGGDNTAFTINGNASDVLLEGMSVINAGTGVSISGGTGTGNTLRAMFLGADAQGVNPGGALRNTAFGVTYASPASGTVEYCLAAYNGQSGISAAQPSASVTITGNEAVGNDWNSNSHDGLDVDGVNCIVRFNLSHHNVTSSGLPNGGGGNGIEIGSTGFVGNMNNLVENNTIHDNTSQGITIRSGAGGNTIRKNVIHSNHIGVLICREGSTAANNVITENKIHGNNTLGIDLSNAASGGDGVTVNDLNDADVGSNGLLNFPVLTSAIINGGNLLLTGHARPGSLIEFFLSDNEPVGFGEGLAWSLSATEGTAGDADATSGSYGPGAINGLLQGTDNTERFSFTVPLPMGVVNGTKLAATATIAGNTSEFSGIVTVFEDLDLDNDGIPNSAEVGDCDGDGVPNNLDLDSDNDGIYDCVESGVNAPQTGGVLNGATTPNGIPVSADTNGDGTIDYTVKDSDGDATIDSCELDADADGCTDVIEAGYTDANSDGRLGPAPLTVDANGLVTSGNN